MTIVLDANIIIAMMAGSDSHHTRVVSFIRTKLVDTEHLCVPMLSWAESLVGQIRANHVQQAEAAIRDLDIEILDGNLADPLSMAYLRINTGLKLPDCVVLASAQKLDAQLATTDKQLAKAAAAVGVSLALSPFVDDDTARVKSASEALAQFRASVPGTSSPVDDLIAERRRDAVDDG